MLVSNLVRRISSTSMVSGSSVESAKVVCSRSRSAVGDACYAGELSPNNHAINPLG